MLKLDNNLLEELGLGGLPEDQKRQMLQHIYETLELRVGTQLANQMTDKQLEEFEKFIDAGGDTNQAQALQWLETNLPNYKQVVQQTFESLKAEVRGMAPQLLAAAQQSQGPQEAQVVAQPVPQGMPMPPAQPAQQPTMPQPSMDTAGVPQQQVSYGQSFQTPQPSYGATVAPVAPAMPVQPMNEAVQSPQPWQTTPPTPTEPAVAPTPTYTQPAPTPMSEPVSPLPTPMQPANDPFVPQAQSQPLQPATPAPTPPFGQPMVPPTATPAWSQQPTQVTPTNPDPSVPSWQPQAPAPAPTPTWQPQPPTDQQPPQAI